MSLLYVFPRFKSNFSFTFSIEICFWWLQTSENNYSAGLFLSRFNRKMSFYQPLHTKTNSSSKVICSLRFIRIHISLRGKTKEYLLDFPLLGKKKIMAINFPFILLSHILFKHLSSKICLCNSLCSAFFDELDRKSKNPAWSLCLLMNCRDHAHALQILQ